MTLRSRLTLLFLGAVQVTFLSAVAAYWALQSWRLLTDDLALMHAQNLRLDRVLDGTAGAMIAVPEAMAELRSHVQTLDESRRVERLAAAVTAGTARDVRRAGTTVRRYYHAELGRLQTRAASLARLSNGLIVGIVAIVIAAFLAVLAAIRAWLVEPVRALERATEVMSTGDLSHRIGLAGDDELARLAAAINRMAESLARIQAKLVVSERFVLLGEMAAYVAHNIRNPLASIRATAQAELIDLPPADPRRPAFADIVTAADRLAAWVADLLRSASPIVLERRTGSLSEVVTRCAELARPRLDAAGVELVLGIGSTPPAVFDQVKLEQVVSTILGNAADASVRGGRIRLELAGDDAGVVLRVTDEGDGIPAGSRARLFTPFATTKPSGTGLGLWLSQKIVTAHSGSLVVLDAPGRGTTVEIRLPIVQEPSCPVS